MCEENRWFFRVLRKEKKWYFVQKCTLLSFGCDSIHELVSSNVEWPSAITSFLNMYFRKMVGFASTVQWNNCLKKKTCKIYDSNTNGAINWCQPIANELLLSENRTFILNWKKKQRKLTRRTLIKDTLSQLSCSKSAWTCQNCRSHLIWACKNYFRPQELIVQ